EIEPVAAEQYARFLPRWQQVGGGLRGPDGVLAALEPLVGVPLPASAIESLILPARVTNYRPSDLDELLAAGELLWQGHGSISADDGWISFHFPDTAPLTLAAHALPSELDAPGREAPAEERSTAAAASSEIARSGAARSDAEPDAQTSDAAASGVVDNTDDADVNGSGVSEPPADQLAEVAGAAAPMTADSGAHGATAESRDDRTAAPTQTGTQKGRSPLTGAAVARALGAGGSHLFADLRTRLATADDSALTSALWDAVWNGHVSGDTFAPVRALLTGGASAHKPRVSTARGSRYARLRGPSLSSRAGRPSAAAAGRTPPTAVGRWRLLPAAEDDLTERTFTRAEGLLARHGIVTRGAVVDEDVVGGFAAVYKVLAGAEERGLVRRGYFVEGLG
ncbi:ATP-dependent helicase, partial [Agromyces sp. NPDC056379]